MILTNVLLSIGFSLARNFSDKLPLPPESVLTTPADIQSYQIGLGNSPTHLIIAHNGYGYWVDHGIVYSFGSSDTFFRLQDPRLISKYTGHSNFGVREVLQISTNAIQSLIKNKYSIDGSPRVEHGSFESQEIPFYRITWYGTNRLGFKGETAQVEVDARSGKIVSLDLFHPDFWDPDAERAIIDRVQSNAGDDAKAHTGTIASVSRPTARQVLEALPHWRTMCQLFDLKSDGKVGIGDVDWSKSFTYTNAELSTDSPVCQIWLTNGVCFQSVNGVVFSHFSNDACFVGEWAQRPASFWTPFKGRILRKWEDLALNLENRLVKDLHFPADLLRSWSPNGATRPPPLGGEDVRRLVVEWRQWPKTPGRSVPIDETKIGFAAEFDLETGDLKWISFDEPKLVHALRESESRGKPN